MEKKLIRSFEDLIVWQKAIEFVTEVSLLTRASLSVTSVYAIKCVARRCRSRRTSLKDSSVEYLLFLNIAKGSAGETRSLFRVALEIGYFSKETHDQLRERAVTISRHLFNQIRSIKSAPPRL